jgi:hypothetical protein
MSPLLVLRVSAMHREGSLTAPRPDHSRQPSSENRRPHETATPDSARPGRVCNLEATVASAENSREEQAQRGNNRSHLQARPCTGRSRLNPARSARTR